MVPDCYPLVVLVQSEGFPATPRYGPELTGSLSARRPQGDPLGTFSIVVPRPSPKTWHNDSLSAILSLAVAGTYLLHSIRRIKKLSGFWKLLTSTFLVRVVWLRGPSGSANTAWNGRFRLASRTRRPWRRYLADGSESSGTYRWRFWVCANSLTRRGLGAATQLHKVPF